jgi:hypothetical protein
VAGGIDRERRRGGQLLEALEELVRLLVERLVAVHEVALEMIEIDWQALPA